MATQEPLDQARTEAFMLRALADVTSTFTTVMASIGDRLQLFRTLAEAPVTSAELAVRAEIDERYAREWLSQMSSAGYLAYDPAGRRFSLPAEHAPVLAQEGGPFFLGAAFRAVLAEIGPYEQLVRAFRQGGGVPPEAYGPDLPEAFARLSGPMYEQLLVPVWLAAMPEVRARLERGARLADVGCGQGRALIALAQSYPHSRFVGYDAFAPVLEQARVQAEAAAVADRVRFEHRDVSAGLPEIFDVITAFDVVHDAHDPGHLLRAIHRALQPGGTLLCLEAAGSDRLEDNVGPFGAFQYGISVLYCLPASCAGGGEGLGTLGLTESKLRALSAEAGFGPLRRVPVEIPFRNLYEIAAEGTYR